MASPSLSRLDMRTSRQSWDDAWNKDLKDTWARYARMPNFAAAIPPICSAQFAESDQFRLHLQQETRVVCVLQQGLAKWAYGRYAEDEFEDKWKALAAADRKEVILEGIWCTMSSPDMVEKREYCPDSTSEYLASQDGDIFLHMLARLSSADPHEIISEPIEIPHPMVDRFLAVSSANQGNFGLRMMTRLHRLSRTHCLTAIVWNTCLIFTGEEGTQLSMNPFDVYENLQPSQNFLDQMVANYHTAVRQRDTHACRTCNKSANTLDPGQKLQACSKCRVNRWNVYYCSRECQVEDWKNGLPIPHKLICGKLIADIPSSISSSIPKVEESPSGIPKADAGYTRTSALLHQISLLQKDKDVDYYIMFPNGTGPEIRVGSRMVPFDTKIRFRILRNRAFRNGNPDAVSNMFAALRGCNLGCISFPHDLIRNQLEDEYNATLTEPIPPAMATREEMTFVMRGLTDPLNRRIAGNTTA